MIAFKSLCIAIFLLLSTSGPAARDAAQTYYLMRCDDMGMCHAVNTAVKRIIDSRLPISVSVMFACPWYQEAVSILRQHPEVGVGVHLTLNAEWENYRWGPVMGREAVPTLVDSAGYFFPSRAALFANQPKMEEIENECRAQIRRALNSGIRIDYIDTHMGAAVQTLPLREMVERLAKEYGLGISGYLGEKYSNITYSAPLGSKSDSLLSHVRNLEPGVNLQVLHVGLDVPEMQALKDLNPFGLTEMSRHREEELESVLHPDLPKILIKRGIIPITYRDLINRVGLSSMHRPDDVEY